MKNRYDDLSLVNSGGGTFPYYDIGPYEYQGDWDIDCDGILNNDDNCPNSPNGTDLGTCANIFLGVIQSAGTTCIRGEDCGVNEFCDLFQFDINDNGIGDVCECYADCNRDTKVNLADLVIMKGEFLRTDCAAAPCDADCNWDNKVDLDDLVITKSEFLRTACPVCP
jgi:hypothetical protein